MAENRKLEMLQAFVAELNILSAIPVAKHDENIFGTIIRQAWPRDCDKQTSLAALTVKGKLE